ncbi:MAG: hypothetical protein P4M12_10395 [Gammaproteobacteria bacterium]|nr:hypothetical protein [Gammaproteobacteria bacterium]
MSSSRKGNVKSASYSTIWNVFGKLKTAALFALMLLESPTQVMANAPKANRNDGSIQLQLENNLFVDSHDSFMQLLNAQMALNYDDLPSFIKIFGKNIPEDRRNPDNYPPYQFPYLKLEIPQDLFGQVCIIANKNIAKYLFDNNFYDSEIFPQIIAATAYEGHKELLEYLNLSKEQATQAFVWLSDIIYIKKLRTYDAFKTYTKAIKLLVGLGADVNAGKTNIFWFALNSKNIDLIRYYLKHGADMYKITKDGNYDFIPLEMTYNQDDMNSYASMVIEFCKNGYDILHPEPQRGKDLANMILDILDNDRLNRFLEVMESSPHTKKLHEEILKNKSIKSAAYSRIGIIAIISIFLIVLGRKIDANLLERASRKEQAKKLKIQLENEKAEKEEFNNKKVEHVVKRKTSATEPEEKVTKITYSSTVADAPKPKIVKSTHAKTAKQLRAEEIAQAKEQARIERESAIIHEKEMARISKEQAELHKAEWKKKQEVEKQERLVRVKVEKTKQALHKQEESISVSSQFTSESRINKNSLIRDYAYSAVEHAASIVVVSALNEDRQSDYYQLNTFVNHLALIYNIHKYNLSMLSFMMSNPKYKQSNELVFAKEMRNLMMHGKSIEESKDVVLETAKQMKTIMPQDLDRLTMIHSHKKAVDENDIKKLMELAGVGKLQTIFLTSLEETPLYKSLSHKADLQINSSFAGASNVYDEDNAYYKWIIEKMFPLINRIASPFNKANVTQLREYYGIALDAIKMLLTLCGEYYSNERGKRFHEAKRGNNLHTILSRLHELRNSVAHDNYETDDRDVLDLCREIARFNPLMCELNNVDISIQAAASSSSVSATPASLFHIKKTLPQEDARVARIERCENPG